MIFISLFTLISKTRQFPLSDIYRDIENPRTKHRELLCALQVLLPPRQPDREVISGCYLQEILGSFLQAEAGLCDHGATGSGAQGEVQPSN